MLHDFDLTELVPVLVLLLPFSRVRSFGFTGLVKESEPLEDTD